MDDHCHVALFISHMNCSSIIPSFSTNIWVFPKIGVLQNGWLIMENPIKMDDLEVPLFSETSISGFLSAKSLSEIQQHQGSSHECLRKASKVELYEVPCFFFSGDFFVHPNNNNFFNWNVQCFRKTSSFYLDSSRDVSKKISQTRMKEKEQSRPGCCRKIYTYILYLYQNCFWRLIDDLLELKTLGIHQSSMLHSGTLATSRRTPSWRHDSRHFKCSMPGWCILWG